MGEWTFFSNHGHVLVCLARDREARLRDVAVQVGITERAVQKIVRDLQDEGYLEVSKHGRRNRYRINNRKALRHPLQAGCTVGQLLKLLSRKQPPEITGSAATQDEHPVEKVSTRFELPTEDVPEEDLPNVVQPRENEPAQATEFVTDQPTLIEAEAVEPEKVEAATESKSRQKKSGKTDLEQGQLF